MTPQPDKPSADERQPRWEMREDYAGSANYMRYWFESPMESLDLHEVPERLNALETALAAANTAREEAEFQARQWKAHHDTQVRWKRRGRALMKEHYEARLAASEARAAALEVYATHKTHCALNYQRNKCSCGFDALSSPATDEAQGEA
jgi:hypothetical protein